MDRSVSCPDPFHPGEKAVQARLGVQERMLDVGRRVIRAYLPEQHREFYAQLPFVLVGSVDSIGRPWASVLVGQPGFMRSPDPTHLHIQARPVPGDPLAQGLVPGARTCSGMFAIPSGTKLLRVSAVSFQRNFSPCPGQARQR